MIKRYVSKLPSLAHGPFRRTVSLVVAIAAVGILLAACSAKSSSSATAATSKNFGENATGTVHFWARAATSTVARAMVKEFNASHPKLKVILTENQPNEAVTQLATALRAGSPPDLIGLNDINMPIFTRKAQFVDLTTQVNALPYESALSPGHLNLAKYDGKDYGVPYLADLSMLWYNKVLFKKAGLDPNQVPANFADMLKDARAVQKVGGSGVYGFSFAGDCQGCLGFTMLPDVWATDTHLIEGSIGSETANITGNKPLEQLLTLYKQVWQEHLAPKADQTQNGSTWGKDFLAGDIGVFPGGYAVVVNNLKGAALKRSEIGAAPLPGPDGGYSTFDGGDDFGIPVGAKNASGAWEFVKFVLERHQQLEYPDLGFTPVRTDVLSPEYLKKHPFDAVVLRALKHGYAPPTTAYNSLFNQPNGPWFAMFRKAVYSGDVSTAIKEAQPGFTEVLKQLGS